MNAPTTPDPIEIAMEAEASGAAPESIAREVLKKQSALIGWQIASERAGFGLRVLTGLAGVVMAAGLIALVWQAKNARGLVIEPFSVPPDLVQQGITGEVVASQVLNAIASMQAETPSVRAADSVSNDWGNDLKVQIPQTGVSIGDVETLLRRWLGHETRISGHVYRSGGQLVIQATAAGLPTAPASGADADLPRMAQATAEGVMRRTQAYRYAVWLARNGRGDEGEAIDRDLAVNGPTPTERAWGYRALGARAYFRGEYAEAVRLSYQGLAERPDMSTLWTQIATYEDGLGHWAAHDDARLKARDLIRRDRTLSPGIRDSYAASLDQPLELRRAAALGAAHRDGEAKAVMAQVRSGWESPTPLLAYEVRLLANAGDWPGAVAAAEAYLLPGLSPALRTGRDYTLYAVALAHVGRVTDAEAVIGQTPMGCDPCVLARAEIAAIAGQRAEAERLFAMVRKRAPARPEVPYRWAMARLDWGDTAGAETLLREAAKEGPAWADPIKAQGDLAARRGDWKGAERLYRRASQLAPQWAALQTAWREARAKATT